MSGKLDRGLKVLEYLVAYPDGKPMSALAQELDMPLSATHRLLTELIEYGYVRQHPGHGQYMLSFRLVSLGLSYLTNSGVVDLAQPLLENLAQETGELVRLAVVDGEELTFVAKAQGARSGLRYDPDMGLSVNLACSAAGHAWLSTMSDDDAMALASKGGFGKPEEFGRNAPRTIRELMTFLRATRKRGFALIKEVFAPGMGSVSAPVRIPRTGEVIGVVTIAGPLVRFNEERMLASGALLLSTANEVAMASRSSAFFRRA